MTQSIACSGAGDFVRNYLKNLHACILNISRFILTLLSSEPNKFTDHQRYSYSGIEPIKDALSILVFIHVHLKDWVQPQWQASTTSGIQIPQFP